MLPLCACAEPTAQGVHEDAPNDALKLPAAHEAQKVAPGLPEKVPAAHALQRVPTLYEPAAQAHAVLGAPPDSTHGALFCKRRSAIKSFASHITILPEVARAEK